MLEEWEQRGKPLVQPRRWGDGDSPHPKPGPFCCAGLLELLTPLDCFPGLPLASAVPNLEWNHLIKAGRVSKMCCERSNSALICRPEPASAQRVLPRFFTRRGRCGASPCSVFHPAYKTSPETHFPIAPAVNLRTFIDVGRGEVKELHSSWKSPKLVRAPAGLIYGVGLEPGCIAWLGEVS